MTTPPPTPTAKKNLLSQLSWHTISADIAVCWHRFPLTVVYVVLLSVWLITDAFSAIPEVLKPSGVLDFIFSAGSLLSLVIYLWLEERPSPRYGKWIQIAGCMIMAADAIWLYSENGSWGWAISIGHGAVIGALLIALFFISFIGEKDDIPAWNFSWSLIKSLVIVGAISAAMALALFIIIMTAHSLFHFDDIWRIEASMMIVGCYTIPAMIFLGRIPSGASKHNSIPLPSRFLTGITRYLFVPTMSLLLIILYAYAIKILVSFELPKGTVSWSVTGAMIGCCLIEFLLYPSHISGSSARDRAIARWLPIAVMPLLVLMTVAALRRISDYGITVERLYLLTFNIWAYGVCIGLFITRARRLYWVPCSFAALFLITSILPVNYTTISRSAVQHDLRNTLTSITDRPLPLSQTEYNKLIDAQTLRSKDKIEGKLHYLQDNFGIESLADIVTIDKKTQRYWYPRPSRYLDDEAEVVTEEVTLPNEISLRYENPVTIPVGFSKVERTNYISRYTTDSIDKNVIHVRYENNDDSFTFKLDIDSLRSIDYQGVMDQAILCPVENRDSAIFIMSYYRITFDDIKRDSIDYINIDGYIFTK